MNSLNLASKQSQRSGNPPDHAIRPRFYSAKCHQISARQLCLLFFAFSADFQEILAFLFRCRSKFKTIRSQETGKFRHLTQRKKDIIRRVSIDKHIPWKKRANTDLPLSSQPLQPLCLYEKAIPVILFWYRFPDLGNQLFFLSRYGLYDIPHDSSSIFPEAAVPGSLFPPSRLPGQGYLSLTTLSNLCFEYASPSLQKSFLQSGKFTEQ